jgi:hypothetical protein
MLGQVLTYLGTRRRSNKNAKAANAKLDEIHHVVNGQNTALITKNVELVTRVSEIQQEKADIIRVAAAGPVDLTEKP